MKSNYPKYDVRYWEARVQKRPYKNKNGHLKYGTFYCFQIRHNGLRKWVNTGKSDKREAGYFAKDFWMGLISDNPDFLERFHGVK